MSADSLAAAVPPSPTEREARSALERVVQGVPEAEAAFLVAAFPALILPRGVPAPLAGLFGKLLIHSAA